MSDLVKSEFTGKATSHARSCSRKPRSFRGTLKSTADGGIRTDTERAQGPRVFSFAFDEGDPLGMYTIDVYVNDRLVESASIQVVDPAAK